jgi:hypothetical protein
MKVWSCEYQRMGGQSIQAPIVVHYSLETRQSWFGPIFYCTVCTLPQRLPQFQAKTNKYFFGIFIPLSMKLAIQLRTEATLDIPTEEYLDSGSWEFFLQCNGTVKGPSHGGRSILIISHLCSSISFTLQSAGVSISHSFLRRLELCIFV